MRLAAGRRRIDLHPFTTLTHQLQHPVWAYGGIGLHTAAACYMAAAGVVLDTQLRSRKNRAAAAVKTAIAAMDGSETSARSEFDRSFRSYSRPGSAALRSLTEMSSTYLRAINRPLSVKRRGVRPWKPGSVGDRCSSMSGRWIKLRFCPAAADRYRTVGGILPRCAKHSPLTFSRCQTTVVSGRLSAGASPHTRYPIVQGPMTRVSDRAEFARRSLKASLPFLALR